jgi:Bacterial alpha-L-rhamnosidase.
VEIQGIEKEDINDWPEGADNHAMYSSYVQWFYEGLAGIKVSKDSYGTDEVFIKPYFEEDIDFVECKYKLIKGHIVSNWNRNEGNISLHIEIPRNLKVCQLILEKKYKAYVSEYAVQKEDESYLYIDISSCKSDIDLILYK